MPVELHPPLSWQRPPGRKASNPKIESEFSSQVSTSASEPRGVVAHAVHAPSLADCVVLPHPLQHLQLPGTSSGHASFGLPRAAVLPRPQQYRQVLAVSGPCPCPPVPLAVVPPRPLQRTPFHESHWQPCSRDHSKSWRPPPAATHPVLACHRQPVQWSHSNTSRSPPPAACEQASFKHSGWRWRHLKCPGIVVLLSRLAYCMSAVAATAPARLANCMSAIPARRRREPLGPVAAAPPAERGRRWGRFPNKAASSNTPGGAGSPCAAVVIGPEGRADVEGMERRRQHRHCQRRRMLVWPIPRGVLLGTLVSAGGQVDVLMWAR
jgi:hypothetical protein